MGARINSEDYSKVISKLRSFCESKGFIEVHTQSRLSILAACEDPKTIATYVYEGQVWPLPQTGQMWLEHELLRNPNAAGYFCCSTSFRNEPNPVEGRHDKIFPMFEFEFKGDMDELEQFESDLLKHLGFNSVLSNDYDKLCKYYDTPELEHEHERKMSTDFADAVIVKNFPNKTSPFWNMKQNVNGTHANKIDVILHGMETIGSAERSCDPDEMKRQFYSISDGEYAKILFNSFTKERVEKELNEFLNFDFVKRCGGGIGVTRLIRAMKLSKLI